VFRIKNSSNSVPHKPPKPRVKSESNKKSASNNVQNDL